MCEPNFVPIHQVDVETFHSRSENLNLLVVVEEKSEDHQGSLSVSSRDPEYLL